MQIRLWETAMIPSHFYEDFLARLLVMQEWFEHCCDHARDHRSLIWEENEAVCTRGLPPWNETTLFLRWNLDCSKRPFWIGQAISQQKMAMRRLFLLGGQSPGWKGYLFNVLYLHRLHRRILTCPKVSDTGIFIVQLFISEAGRKYTSPH